MGSGTSLCCCRRSRKDGPDVEAVEMVYVVPYGYSDTVSCYAEKITQNGVSLCTYI